MKVFSGLIIFISGLFLTFTLSRFFFPKTVNPPFSKEEKYTPLLLGTPSGKRDLHSVLTFNESGARGSHYRNQKYRCALIAGSTFQSRPLTEQHSFHYLLMKERKDIHIDNFSLNGMTARASVWFIKKYIIPSKKYNCILYSNWFSHDPWKKNDILRNWARLDYPFSKIHLWPKRWLKQYKSNKDWGNFLPSTYEQTIAPKIHPKYLERKKVRKLRQSGKVTFSKVPIPTLENPENQLRQKESNELIQLLKKNFKKIVIISQPISYDENQHPEVSQRWKILIPHPTKIGEYYDDESLAKRDRFYMSLIERSAKERNISYIDLDFHLRAYLKSPQYFADRRHFTPEGMQLASKIVLKKLKELGQ